MALSEKIKILIVEDNRTDRTIFRLTCQKGGYETIEVDNGPEAILVAAEEMPDLILMDIMTAEMNGLDTTEILKKKKETNLIPIIVITGATGRENRLKAIEKGASDFLNKPVDPQELLLRIRNNLVIKKYGDFLKNYNQQLEMEVQNRTKDLQEALENLKVSYRKIDTAYRETIEKLARAADFKDPDTGEHIKRVGLYVEVIADKLYVSTETTYNLACAAPMHDVGKVGIPDRILLKKRPLNAEEWEVMKTHTIIGHQILSDSSSAILKCAAEISLTHHEKWDGKGYPQGLSGQEIPLSGRIMALGDIYDALRSCRPYKDSFSHSETVKIITQGDGRTMPCHFDPQLLNVFEKTHRAFEEIFEAYKDPEEER